MIANDISECGCTKRTLYSNPGLHKPYFLQGFTASTNYHKLSREANPLSLNSKMQNPKRQITSDRK